MKTSYIDKRSIQTDKSILDALKIMDSSKTKLLFVFEGEKFEGLLTIGDIQRAILKDVNLTSSVAVILDKNKIYASIDEPLESIKAKVRSLRAECMPVLDHTGNLIKVYSWSDLFGNNSRLTRPELDLHVVIMAGGKGTRLAPLTNVYPKPLIPIAWIFTPHSLAFSLPAMS
jgi:CBS-domain-containing membrane protein